MDMRFAVAGGGGGCVTRYVVGGYGGGDGGCGLYDISMVDKMMLKFRPIAPKPVVSGSSGSGSGDSTAENGYVSGRSKRRYSRVKGSKNKKRKVEKTSSDQDKEGAASGSSGGDNTVVTLSLMPETPDREKENLQSSSPAWLSFKNMRILPERIVSQKTVTSFVTVERVVAMKVDGGGGGSEWLGWTEMERDTCPGFISDGGDKVVWMNKAYKEMATGGGGGEEVVAVVVVRKVGEKWPAAFTCNVRVTCHRSGVISTTKTVPCDAWRMEGGGYAWRLDVKAALSLGR